MNLDRFTQKAQEAIVQSQQIAQEMNHQSIEPAHLLLALLQPQEGVVPAIVTKLSGSTLGLREELTQSLDHLPKITGSGVGEVGLSRPAADVLQAAERYAKGMQDDYVSTEHLLLALTESSEGKRLAQYGITKDAILRTLTEVRGNQRVTNQNPEETYQALEKYGRDLTAAARQGKLDPVIGRDEEIRRVVQILSRRSKNNPALIGDPGVGKTAIVEGLALRIVSGEVPAALKGVELLCLDLGLLQAGASVKGEFERRLQGVIDEVKGSAKPIILFIDEAHTLIGAGGQAGSGDAANLLKPALARGELRTIAATTWSEYKKYFEKDPALARRFQPVQLHEPSVPEAVTILRGLAPVYEKSHGIYLRDDAVTAAAELSARYLAGRQLPDKAVDVLDTACARVRISLAAAPEALERLRGEVAEGERQREAMRRDLAAGLPVDAAVLQRLEQRLFTAGDEIEQLESRWTRQRQLAERLLELRKRTAEARSDANEDGETPSLDELESELRAVQAELAIAQAEQRLVSHEVCPRLVAEVISHWTGVPLTQLAREHNAQVANFAADLRARVRGQEQAVEALDRAMRAAAAGLNKPDAPVGVFLLVGPSGVGKTETALALADLLYGGERFLTVINMSEFQEKHSVSRLIGAPSTPMRWSRANAFEPSKAPHCLAHSSACLPRRSGWCHCAASLGSTRSGRTCQSWSHNGVPLGTTREQNG